MVDLVTVSVNKGPRRFGVKRGAAKAPAATPAPPATAKEPTPPEPSTAVDPAAAQTLLLPEPEQPPPRTTPSILAPEVPETLEKSTAERSPQRISGGACKVIVPTALPPSRLPERPTLPHDSSPPRSPQTTGRGQGEDDGDEIQHMSLASLIASPFEQGELSRDESQVRQRQAEQRQRRREERLAGRSVKDETASLAGSVVGDGGPLEAAWRGERRTSMSSVHSAATAATEAAGDAGGGPAAAPVARPQLVLVNGQLVIDQSSLTVLRETNEGEMDAGFAAHLVQDDDEARHITSASYGKKTRSQRWTREETRDLYEALQIFGTDFEMIAMAAFPHRTRAQLKNKFNKEERVNRERIMFALSRRKRFSMAEHGHFPGAEKLAALLSGATE